MLQGIDCRRCPEYVLKVRDYVLFQAHKPHILSVTLSRGHSSEHIALGLLHLGYELSEQPTFALPMT